MKAINFNSEMAKAVLDGRKTQTRRVMKIQPDTTEQVLRDRGAWCEDLTLAEHITGAINMGLVPESHQCPYGKVGDLLYVREPFIQGYDCGNNGELIDEDADGNDCQKTFYKATDDGMGWLDDDDFIKDSPPWKSSTQMPKELSRITLKITSIRVERLQEISEADAKAEGAYSIDFGFGDCFAAGFNEAWDGLYPAGPKSWGDNPWVWVIDFEVVMLHGTLKKSYDELNKAH